MNCDNNRIKKISITAKKNQILWSRSVSHRT